MNLIVGAIIFLVALALVMSGKLRTLLSGFLSLFVEDLSKTPEGAEAVYTKAIEEAQNEYNEAETLFRKVAGQLNEARMKLKEAEELSIELDKKAKTLATSNRDEEALEVILAKEEADGDAEIWAKTVTNLTKTCEDAKEMHANREQMLRKLIKDKKQVVTQLRMNKQMSEIYDSMDELKNKKTTDKLIAGIKDKVVDGKNEVAGAKMIHENKSSTKMQRIDEVTKKSNATDYLEKLKAGK